MLKFSASQVSYGEDQVIATYQKDQGKHYRTAEIPEYVLVETGAITANTTVSFNLSEYETVLRPESVYVSSTAENKSEIEFYVYNTLTTPVSLVFFFTIDWTELPYRFAPIPLFPFNSISIKPKYTINNAFVSFVPCGVLHHKKL